MSTLKFQVEKLQSQIKLSSNAQENETIIKANSNILNRLNKSLGELVSTKAKFNVMPLISSLDKQLIPRLEGGEGEGFLISELSELVLGDDVKGLLVDSKSSISHFSEKWKELEHKAQQDDSLNNSIVAVKSLTKTISSLNDNYWDQWLINLENEFFVEEIVLEQQSTIPGQSTTLATYTKAKANFDAEKLSKDINPSLVKDLHDLKSELSSLREKMDTSELPTEVAKFLKELNGIGRTPTLDLVTPTVFEWLSKQGLLPTLKISR